MLTIAHRLADTPLRPAWIRSPGRMQNTFANEGFLDELAIAAKADPFEFRIRYLDNSRREQVLPRREALAVWQGRMSRQRVAAVVPAAISNPVFEAVGVRLRSVPFLPAKVLAALKEPVSKERT
jgi:CO/xanthine dehydrogenase Mo-binding subunit